jgi:ATP-dependent DNA ligase
MPPPRKTRFGSPLVLSQVHWVEPQLVAEITYLTWTADGLLRHTVYIGSEPTSLRARFAGKRRPQSSGLRTYSLRPTWFKTVSMTCG